MITFLSLSFWLFFILFLIAVFCAFYIPGTLLLKKLHLSPFQHIVLSLIVGMVLWGWQGFIFGFLGIRWVSFVYVLSTFILWWTSEERKRFLQNIKTFSIKRLFIDDWLLSLLIIIGTIFQLFSIVWTGIMDKSGISFCCALPDTFYHIALTNQLVKEFPPTEPGMAGVIVHNYHYLSNLVGADLIRVFHLPLIATQFQYLVLLLSLLLGLSAIVFGQVIHMGKSYLRWLVFFLYFSGDITYILSFFTGKGFDFTTPFLENASWLWISPPRVFATVVFFAGLSLFTLWIKRKELFLGILMAVVFSSLISFKVYNGIFMAVGLVMVATYFFFSKQFRMLLPLLLTGVLTLLLYIPVNAHAGGLIYTGPWRFEDFVVQPGFNLSHFELAREIYASHHNWLGVARFELFFMLLYFIFVFGTIILGIFQTKKSLSLFPKELNIFLLSGIVVCAILGFFFIQQAGGANSSQFLITIDIIASIYTALACFYWLGINNKVVKYILIILIVAFTIPRVLYIQYQQLTTPSFTIDTKQLDALSYIQKNTPANAIILADNTNREKITVYDKKSQKFVRIPAPDKRAWAGNYSYFISFLANRSLYIDGNNKSIVESHGINIDQRIAIEKTIIDNLHQRISTKLLHQNGIDYIYLESSRHIAKYPPKFVKRVFQNSEVTLLKIL